MEFRLLTITANNTLCVSLADARAHLRIDSDNTTEDAQIQQWIKVATAAAENYLNRALLNTTFEQKFDSWNNNELLLYRTPVSSITSVKYFDTDGAEQTLAADQYELDKSIEPSVIVPAYQVNWPSLRGHRNDVAVRYIAGYGASASDIPTPIIQAILVMLTTMYEKREDYVHRMPTASIHLLNPYRVLWL